MRKLSHAVAAILLAATLTACADAPSAPAAAPTPDSRELLGLPVVSDLLGLLTPTLRRTTPVGSGLATTVTIGSEGGTIQLPAAGLTVTVPRGAVAAPVAITARAIPGYWVAYDFEPHGIRFAQPLRMTQDLRNTSAGLLGGLALRAVYFDESGDFNALTGLVLVSEVLPTTVNLLSQKATFDVRHFSGYAISTGRKAAVE